MSAKIVAMCKQALTERGLKFTEHQNGYRLAVVGKDGRVIDYYPSNGRFEPQDGGYPGRGITRLMRLCGVEV